EDGKFGGAVRGGTHHQRRGRVQVRRYRLRGPFSAAPASTGRAWAFCGWASAIRASVWKQRLREPSRPEPLLPEREVDAGTRARPPTPAVSGRPAAPRT